jgi:hypothetical protein
MQTVFKDDKALATAIDAVQHGSFVATPIKDDLSWGKGQIEPEEAYTGTETKQQLVQTVLDSLAVVNNVEKRYSSCTDGRVPVRLHNGEAVPVREQLVGADTMVVFHMAEVLGGRFYRDPKAPLADRLQEVAVFLHENGLLPCTHIGCGAAGSYVQIVQNLIEFTKNEQFNTRQKNLLPEGTYSDTLREAITKGYEARLQNGAYEGWSDQLVLDAVHKESPDRAIAELNNDGRGVHGHVEELIIRIQVDDIATNELQVIARTGGREVFSVNDVRMRHLAGLISRGHDEDYRLALMAAEDFTDGGHGTLAKNLPTYIITVVEQ